MADTKLRYKNELMTYLRLTTGKGSIEEISDSPEVRKILSGLVDEFARQLAQKERDETRGERMKIAELELKLTDEQRTIDSVNKENDALYAALKEKDPASAKVLDELRGQVDGYRREFIVMAGQIRDQMLKRLDRATEARKLRDQNEALEAKLNQIVQLPLAEDVKPEMDPKLSKLYNAHYGVKRLEDAVVKSIASGEPLAVALLDVDKFKLYNDLHGYKQADKGLYSIQDIVAQGHRATDFVFRFGGDEICIVFPNTPKENAFNKMEHLRKTISNHEVPRHPQIRAKDDHYFLTRSYKHVTISAAVIDVRDLDIDALRQQNEQSNRESQEKYRQEAIGLGITGEEKIKAYVEEQHRPDTLGDSIIQYLSGILKLKAKEGGRDRVVLGEPSQQQ